ncbi:hypothetical protein CPAR01_12533, partial [Colletotrichum paranaense]
CLALPCNIIHNSSNQHPTAEEESSSTIPWSVKHAPCSSRAGSPALHACMHHQPSPSQECTTAHKHAFPLSLFPSSPSPCLAFQQCSNPPARVITLYRTWLKHNTLGPSPLSDIFDMQGQAAASHVHGLKTQRNKIEERQRSVKQRTYT